MAEWVGSLGLSESASEVPSFDDMVSILQYYQLATEHNHASYKGWHAWAFMNYEALNSLRQQTPHTVV